eukprot:5517906-Prymnesium_polylepis.1
MDGLSGDELLVELRQILDPAVAIVMASSASQVELVKKCLDMGADGFLVKPIHSHTIQLAWQYCYRCAIPPRPDARAASCRARRLPFHASFFTRADGPRDGREISLRARASVVASAFGRRQRPE